MEGNRERGVRAFVTGGSGFIGGKLIERLLADGGRVRALARSDRAAERVATLGAEPVRGDLTDAAALEAGAAGSVSAIANVRPDLVIGLARAFVEGRSAEAKALQQEIAALRSALSDGPALAALKRATAEKLREDGISYPATLRAPLG